MKVLGIVVEYNPFHNGHLHHLDMSKKATNADFVIAVMSGNFVQRGEPAFCDKFERCKMALEAGVDMVLELPTLFATASAEYFAQASIDILNAVGIVDYICFGAEDADVQKLYDYANVLAVESDEFKAKLKENLSKGISYPTAREQALGLDKGYFTPNNILGVEYLKALIRSNSRIEPFALERNRLAGKNIESATNIRNKLYAGDLSALDMLPKTSAEILAPLMEEKISPVTLDTYSHVFHYLVRTLGAEGLREIWGVDEGIENRVIEKAGEFFKISDVLMAVKSKRYTFTKLQRMAIHILLGITKEDFNKFYGRVNYVRVLGFRKEAKFLLGEIKKNVPLVTNVKSETFELLQKDIYATDIYYLGTNFPAKKGMEYKKPLIVYSIK